MTNVVSFPNRPALSAPKVLLMGPPGTGKTHSIATLLQAGLEVFVIVTEPNGVDSLLDATLKAKLPVDKLHWTYIPPIAGGWTAFDRLGSLLATLDYEGISKLKDINKADSGQFRLLLSRLQNFKDERTGQEFGDVTSWDSTRALVIDSLSGLNIICMQALVGLKPTMAPGEWNVCMNAEESLINKLTSDMTAFFVLLAHVDRNQNEASLQTVVTPAAIGAKLGPRIGRFFSEVVYTKRVGSEFFWSTMEAMTDTKNRVLPLGDKLAPSFAPIVAAFKTRRAAITN